jgi:hypothetical protein
LRRARRAHEHAPELGDEAVSALAPIACVFGACRAEWPAVAAALAGAVADKGCRLFCFVGPASEAAHDAFDWDLQDKGLCDVITTWHSAADGWHDAVTMTDVMDIGHDGVVLCVLLEQDPAGLRALHAVLERY